MLLVYKLFKRKLKTKVINGLVVKHNYISLIGGFESSCNHNLLKMKPAMVKWAIQKYDGASLAGEMTIFFFITILYIKRKAFGRSVKLQITLNTLKITIKVMLKQGLETMTLKVRNT